MGPIHKSVDPPHFFDGRGARSEKQVIIVGQDDLSSDTFQVGRGERLYGCDSTYGHKNRCFDCAVRCGSNSGTAVGWEVTGNCKFEHEQIIS